MQSRGVLIAVGPEGVRQEWKLHHPSYQVGRKVGRPLPERIEVAGDPLLSRHHFDLTFSDGVLEIVRNPAAKNPLFFQGQDQDSFTLEPGQGFLAGKTRFEFQLQQAADSTAPTTEYTMLRTELAGLRQQNSAECFRAMVELLPQLRESAEAATAFSSTLEVLRSLLPEAAELMVLRLQEQEVEVMDRLCPITRSVTTPPSRGLLRRAFEQSATVAHVWSHSGQDDGLTQHAQADWAVASPVTGASQERHALYVIGTGRAALSDTEVQRQKSYLDDMGSLIDIVAETLGHHLAVQALNQFEGRVTRFFSPVLRKKLAGRDFSEIMKPKRRQVTVMFFDLRGFSMATEAAEAAETAEQELAQILEHHETLTEVMTTVTDCVFAEDGVVIDYQGDAVLACWGALSEGAEANKAVRAAQAIVERIHAMNLRCGLGLASGEAIAGQVGAREQFKFGVLGRVVNLASRLEGLTKFFGVPVLMSVDSRAQLEADTLCRRIGLVRPAGVNDSVEIHELVIPTEHGGSGLSGEEVEAFEKASRLFTTGDMAQAYQALLTGSKATDPVGRFLTRRTLEFLDDGVPKGWDGVLEFTKK